MSTSDTPAGRAAATPAHPGAILSPAQVRLALLALAIGAFGIGTTEFAPMGLLPVIAEGVGVSIPTAGGLVSAYAIGVMVGAPAMTLLLARWSRRKALIALMAIFTLGNLLSALAPGYLSLMGARIVTSLNHGAFFGLGSLVAASIVPPAQRASAIAAMFMGLTIANVGGVPAATWLGQTIGWRLSFAATAGLGVLAMLALWRALPADPAGQRPNVRSEMTVLTRRPVVMAMAATVLSSGAMFALYTYITPTLVTLTRATPGFVTAMLMVIGLGFTVGNWLGGKLADRSLQGTLVAFFLLEIGTMLAFPLLATSAWGAGLTLFVWGVAAFGLVPPLQMRVMSAATGAPGLASSVNIGAFNLGNAVGAALGAAVLWADLGYGAVSVAGAGLGAVGLLLVLWEARRSAKPETNAACPAQ